VSNANKRERQKENRERARVERDRLMKRDQRVRLIRNVAIAAALAAVVIVIVSIVSNKSSSKSSSKSCSTTAPKNVPAKNTSQKAPPMTIDTTKTYIATMDTSCGTMQITLDPSTAPKTVNSFVTLARQGFYDGLKFHRIVKDFVAQGGAPKADGSGGPGYNLPTEPPENGYKKYGVAMANSGPNTTGSQFFIILSDNGAKALGGPPYLYSGLGQVTKGTDVVDKLGKLYNSGQTNNPATQHTSQPVYINKVTISQS
jgi:cyclophilin family peptidyl-prolyl cis-trans isomerase